MVRGYLAHFAASRLARSSKLDNSSHLTGTEAKPSGPVNETERADMVLVVGSVPPFRSLRGSEDSDPLEISDCLRVYACPPRQVTARDARPKPLGRSRIMLCGKIVAQFLAPE